jgi:hypothetical protein
MRTSNPQRRPLPEASCPHGYTVQDLDDLLGTYFGDEFMVWMSGQTKMICEGYRYDHDRRETVPSQCAGSPHGVVVYPWDLQRWIDWKQGGPTPLWD